jgi:hypothetical protein
MAMSTPRGAVRLRSARTSAGDADTTTTTDTAGGEMAMTGAEGQVQGLARDATPDPSQKLET